MTLKLIKNIPENIWAEKNNDGYNEVIGGYKARGDFELGRNSIILNPNKVLEYVPELRRIYPRNNVTLKIYYNNEKQNLSTIIQIKNILALYGLAPRVYNLIDLSSFDGLNNYRAQIIEYIKNDYCYDTVKLNNIASRIRDFCYQKHIEWSADIYISNIKGNTWLDFDNFRWLDFALYNMEVISNFIRYTNSGNSQGAYQECRELGVKGGRGNNRINLFELNNFDWTNKTVLDIGCNGGMFVNYCASKGARAVGIDLLPVVLATAEAANLQYIFNAEYYYFDLSMNDENFLDYLYKVTGLYKFDYVFFLSMHQHVGFKEYLKDIAGTLFFETNGGKPVEEEFKFYNKKLKEMFRTVEYKGLSREGPERNLFVCH